MGVEPTHRRPLSAPGLSPENRTLITRLSAKHSTVELERDELVRGKRIELFTAGM